MSESKVPLPDPLIKGWELAECSYALWDEDQMRSYGDARAAEARRLALLEAAELCEAKHVEVQEAGCRPGCDSYGHDADCYYAFPEEGIKDCAKLMRALADDAQPAEKD